MTDVLLDKDQLLDAEASEAKYNTSLPSGRNQRKLLNYQERCQLDEWTKRVERSFQMHRRAAIMYEKWNFWFHVLPTIFFTSLSAVIALVVPYQSKSQEFWTRTSVACLNSVSAIVIGIANYWKWPAKAEKNSFASHEYNSLQERIMLLRNKIETGQATFAQVLSELETKMNQIRKQCGPAPLAVEQHYANESLFFDFFKVKRIQDEQEIHRFELAGIPRCCTFMLPRACLICCRRNCCKKRKQRRTGQTKIAWAEEEALKLQRLESGNQLLDLQISRIGNAAQGVMDFKKSFWSQLSLAIERNDRQACLAMVMIVSPVAQLQLVDQEPNCRNLLHLITHEGFEEFGRELFSWVEHSVGLSFTLALQLLLRDNDGFMPLIYALQTSNQQLWEPGSFVMDLLVKSFEAWCFATSGELMHSAIDDIPCA